MYKVTAAWLGREITGEEHIFYLYYYEQPPEPYMIIRQMPWNNQAPLYFWRISSQKVDV